jgi:hypothetical protein
MNTSSTKTVRFVLSFLVVAGMSSMLFLNSLAPAAAEADSTAQLAEDVPGVNAVPSPSPVPSPCEYYRGELQYLGTGYGDAGVGDAFAPGIGVIAHPFSVDPRLQGISCVQNLITETINWCPVDPASDNWFDDCYARHVGNMFFSDWTNEYDTVEGKGHNAWTLHHREHKQGLHANGAYCDSVFNEEWWQDGGNQRECKSGHFYFDNNCQTVTEGQVQSTCGTVSPAVDLSVSFIESCPLSLLWTADADVDSELTLTAFPLNPGAGKMWSAWKASAKAPLLVYNPSHDGRITSPTQLFGHWAFGGQSTAYLGNGGTAVQPKRWQNGYEALATLDQNRDGKISGAELEPLGLWFDENRDGISQPGEVKRLEEVGVTALYYKPDHTDAVSGSIYAKVGFERMVESKVVTGASVDWYGATADSRFELIDGYAGLSKKQDSASASENTGDETDAVLASFASKASVTGAWKWHFKDRAMNAGELPEGYLIFAPRLDNAKELTGYAVTEKFYTRSPQNKLRSFASVFALRGKRTVDLSGDTKLAFSSSYQGSETKSEASLSSDGKILSGQTSVDVQRGGKLQKLTYNWIAERM